MDKLKECQIYIKTWYMGEPIITVEMDGASPHDELCIQTMVVELLRNFIDHPIPEGFKENSQQLNNWVEATYQKVSRGLNFGFSPQQHDAVKNLAFNYYIDGIVKTQSDPVLKLRLFKCWRGMLDKKH